MAIGDYIILLATLLVQLRSSGGAPQGCAVGLSIVLVQTVDRIHALTAHSFNAVDCQVAKLCMLTSTDESLPRPGLNVGLCILQALISHSCVSVFWGNNCLVLFMAYSQLLWHRHSMAHVSMLAIPLAVKGPHPTVPGSPHPASVIPPAMSSATAVRTLTSYALVRVSGWVCMGLELITLVSSIAY